MDEDTYKQLLDKNEELAARVDELEKKLVDVTNFNKALLNRNTTQTTEATPGPNMQALEEKLTKGLKHA